MNENKISVRYAKALFSLGKEEKALDVLKKDMELLYQCIKEIPELQYVIQSPVIKKAEKIRLFKESFQDSFNPFTFSFINLVLENRREEYLTGISRYFLDLLKANYGIRSADLVTAIPVDENLRKSIIQLIARKFDAKVELHEQVDQNIIGGFILRVDDQQIDASISSKLSRIKRELINSHSR
jgi:F-type H+-transporting ATPase subunit delta